MLPFVYFMETRANGGESEPVNSTCGLTIGTQKSKHQQAFTTPEILRVSLEQTILQTKLLELGDPVAFLSRAIEPPRRESIESSILHLQQLNALNTAVELTPLGFHLSVLPVSAFDHSLSLVLARFQLRGRTIFGHSWTRSSGK